MALIGTKIAEQNYINYGLTCLLLLTFMYEAYYELTYSTEQNLTESIAEKGIGGKRGKGLQKNKLRSLSRRWFKAIVIVYGFLSIKYLLLCLLNLDYFAGYRFLDCYVVGRIAFSTKSYNATRVLIVIALIFSLVFRLIIVNKTAQSVNYELFRFFELDSEEVVSNEIQLRRYRKALRRGAINLAIENTIKYDDIPLRYSLEAIGRYSPPVPHHEKFRFYFENPFESRPDRLNSILLRLNRKSDARQMLKNAMIIYYPIALAIFLFIPMIYMYFFILETTVTSKGFLINYDNCIKHIESLSPEEALLYSHIYRTNLSLLPSGSITSVPILSPYHIIRLFADVIEFIFAWCECCLAVALYTNIMILQLLDLTIYLKLLKEKVQTTIEYMRYNSMTTVEHVKMVRNLNFALVRDQKYGPPETDCCAATTQADILDYLRLVASYRGYARFQTSAILLVWVAMAMGTSFWLAVNKFDDLRGEWRWAQLGVASYAIVAMGTLAYFESSSRKLYTLMSSAMAVDNDIIGTKLRWCHLTMFFHPKPLYCITILDISKYSWLSCMQVSYTSH